MLGPFRVLALDTTKTGCQVMLLWCIRPKFDDVDAVRDIQSYSISLKDSSNTSCCLTEAKNGIPLVKQLQMERVRGTNLVIPANLQFLQSAIVSNYDTLNQVLSRW
jgi:hypothetical protein